MTSEEQQTKVFFQAIAEAIIDSSDQEGKIQADTVLNALAFVALDIILHCPIESQMEMIRGWHVAGESMLAEHLKQYGGTKQ